MQKKASIRAISIILLTSLSLVLINTVCNGHFHKLADGTLIFHAHPYNKNSSDGSEKNHQHNKIELFYYYFLSHLLELCFVIVTLLILAASLNRFKLVNLHHNPLYTSILLPLRAPPYEQSNAYL